MITRLDNDPRARRAIDLALLDRPSTAPYAGKENTRMLLHEELARARIQEMHRAVLGRRQVRLARAAQRWDRVARWAAKRSRRYGGS